MRLSDFILRTNIKYWNNDFIAVLHFTITVFSNEGDYV
jgi:hypothetical protein